MTPWAAACQASLSFTVSLNLLKFTSSGAIPPSYTMLFPSPPALNLSQHRGFSNSWFFTSGDILEFQLPCQSFLWIFGTDFLQDWLVGSPCSPRDSQEYSPAPQFESINSSALIFLYSPTLNICTWLLEKPQLWLYGLLSEKWCLSFFIHCLGLLQLSLQEASVF